MERTGSLQTRSIFLIMSLILATAVSGCQDESLTDPGYLRGSHPRGGKLIIFDANTFEVHRTVNLPPSIVNFSHRLEVDPTGRIWIGYSQEGIDHLLRKKDRVLVLSPGGDVEHELDLDCGPLDNGIAFAHGYAFVGCAASGFYGKVIVVDTNTMEVVKTFDKVHPPDEEPSERWFYINALAEASDSILVIGFGNPPKDYQPLTNHASAVTRIGVIDPQTLTFRGYQTGLEPGLRVLSALEVDGQAWLFNELSHLEEHPDRTDVYVMDPQTLQIVDTFNLNHPFPTWAQRTDDGKVYIFHRVPTRRLRDAGHQSGITQLDLATGVETFVPTPDLPYVHGMGLLEGRPCLAHKRPEDSGLWCLNDDGVMELKVPAGHAVGVLFGSLAPEG